MSGWKSGERSKWDWTSRTTWAEEMDGGLLIAVVRQLEWRGLVGVF